MTIKASVALRNGLLQGSSVKEQLDGGFIYIYAGAEPADADTALDMVSTHTQLAKIAADAVPALAGAYGLEVIWDESLAEEPELYFEAGDHRTLVHMKTRDFIEMMRDSGHATHFAEPRFVMAAWNDEDDAN